MYTTDIVAEFYASAEHEREWLDALYMTKIRSLGDENVIQGIISSSGEEYLNSHFGTNAVAEAKLELSVIIREVEQSLGTNTKFIGNKDKLLLEPGYYIIEIRRVSNNSVIIMIGQFLNRDSV